MDLTILEIAGACGGRLVLQGLEETDYVSSVAIDSRLVAKEGVFIATKGERVDGHSFIPQAFQKGASLVICEKAPEQVERECGISRQDWGSYLQVEDSFQALKDLAEYYRAKLTLPVVGITGSVGKTSTKEFIAGVLSQKYRVLKTEGNYNNEVGVPLTLLRIRKEHTAAVVEMGISDFGEMHRLSKMVRPDICVITNIGQCHLENLKTRDGILQAKSEIFDYMSESGAVVLNGEDDKLSAVGVVQRGSCLKGGGKPGEPLFFGLGGNDREEVYATDITGRGLWGSEAILHLRSERGRQSFRIKIPLPGRHMVMNAVAAACVARLLSLNRKEIVEGIGKIQAAGGRGRLLRLPRYTLIDECYNANPVSMRAALELLAMADGCKVAILGDMFELGEDSDTLHARVGGYGVQSGVDKMLCVGENARHMYRAAREEAAPGQEIFYFSDRQELMTALESHRETYLPTGCTVLLKASHGMNFTGVLSWLQDFLQSDG
ncbi:MAG: UDP-N-acetylmuramoyl-tripeptide--D-alanyl-D-alanine ligase [Roseburia sp.]|nr:UDP-N-acetylmuramoyl-tripeptide--D-alanyl-D-alanine ligase [Roseburia sp.]